MAVGTVRDKCREGGRWRVDGLPIIRLRQQAEVQNGVKRVSLKAEEKEKPKARDKTSTRENVSFPAAK